MKKVIVAAFAVLSMSTANAQNVSSNSIAPTTVGVSSLPALPTGANSIGTVVLGAGSANVGFVNIILDKTSTVAAITTSGTPSTFTTALASSGTRAGCLIQYTGVNIAYIFVGAGSATLATSLQLKPGNTFQCPAGSGVVVSDTIQIASTGASDTAVVISQ